MRKTNRVTAFVQRDKHATLTALLMPRRNPGARASWLTFIANQV
jgi:hypothetical protein